MGTERSYTESCFRGVYIILSPQKKSGIKGKKQTKKKVRWSELVQKARPQSIS